MNQPSSLPPNTRTEDWYWEECDDNWDKDDDPEDAAFVENDPHDGYQCPYCGHVLGTYVDDGDGCQTCRPELFGHNNIMST